MNLLPEEAARKIGARVDALEHLPEVLHAPSVFEDLHPGGVLMLEALEEVVVVVPELPESGSHRFSPAL